MQGLPSPSFLCNCCLKWIDQMHQIGITGWIMRAFPYNTEEKHKR